MPVTRHVPQALTDYTIKCTQDKSVFGLAEALAPTKKVGKESDKFYKYSVTDQFLKQELIRADKARAQRISLTELSASTFTLDNHAVATEISDRERANADPSVDPEFDAAEELAGMMYREKELLVSKVFFTTTSFGTNLTTLTTNQYDFDTTTSAPITDSKTAARGVLRTCGQVVNGCAMGQATFDILIDHSDVLDRIKWSERGIVSEDILASVLGVDKLYVSKAVYNAASEGLAASMTFIFDTKLLYFYNAKNPGVRNGNLGTTFSGMWGGTEPTMKRYREEDISSDILELNWMYKIALVNSLSGYMIAGANT